MPSISEVILSTRAGVSRRSAAHSALDVGQWVEIIDSSIRSLSARSRSEEVMRLRCSEGPRPFSSFDQSSGWPRAIRASQNRFMWATGVCGLVRARFRRRSRRLAITTLGSSHPRNERAEVVPARP